MDGYLPCLTLYRSRSKLYRMNSAVFTFHGELNDFLRYDRRGKSITLSFGERQSVKHLFESLGVPHTEVGRVLVEGKPSDFTYLVKASDRIDVLPFEPEQLDLAARFGWVAFLLDLHLGKLASLLRILGFDTLYRNDFEDDELAEIAASENRLLLTRDRRLLMQKRVRWGYCVRSLIPNEQAFEVVKRFNLRRLIVPFQRCPHCNTVLEPVSKQSVIERLEPLTRKYFDEFHLCPGCDQIYWKGSHFGHLETFIRQFEG